MQQPTEQSSFFRKERISQVEQVDDYIPSSTDQQACC